MVSLPRYDKYTDSGIEWLGEIPEHWTLLKSKYLWKEIDERSISGNEQLLSVSQYSGIVPKKDDSRSEELTNYKICNPSDLVINIMLAWMGGLGVSKLHGIVSPAYCVYRLKEDYHSNFFGYLYRTNLYLSEFARWSKGVIPSRWRMYTENFGQVVTILPPITEQKRIAEFLDRKCGEIDEAIAKKQHLIELLEEQKTILINQAVTKSLDPNAPMKDSGIEWLGEIPAHWKIKKAKHLFQQSRLSVRKEDGVVTCYRDGEVTLRTNRRADGYTVAILEQGYQGIRKGQLVINSMDAFAGSIGVSDSNGKCSPEYVICNPLQNEEVLPEYYALLLREMALSGFIEIVCPAVRQRGKRMRYSNFAPLPLPVPPFEDQKSVVNHTKFITGEIQKFSSKIQVQIKKLVELKQILIAEAVTGKIKV